MITSNSSVHDILEYLVKEHGLLYVTNELACVCKDEYLTSRNDLIGSCWDSAARAFKRIAGSAYVKRATLAQPVKS